MKKSSIIMTAICMCVIFITGCSGSKSDPKSVAEAFWKAMKTGDIASVKKYMTGASAKALNESTDKEKMGKEGKITLGDAKIEKDKATVPTTIDNEGVKMELQTILVKQDGKWKVDLDQTMMSMFGGAMGEMMKGLGGQMGEGLNQMGKELEDMGKAIEEQAKKLAPPAKELDKSLDSAKNENKYPVGTQVVVEWRGSWWPAKIIESKEGVWKINYDGYDSSWDEWVGAERIKSR